MDTHVWICGTLLSQLCKKDTYQGPTWKKSSSADWTRGFPPACSSNQPELVGSSEQKMSAALRCLVGELKHLGEHYRFFALTETSVTSCATSLSHCLCLFCILTLPTPKCHNGDVISELNNSFHKFFKFIIIFFLNMYMHSRRPSVICRDRQA